MCLEHIALFILSGECSENNMNYKIYLNYA